MSVTGCDPRRAKTFDAARHPSAAPPGVCDSPGLILTHFDAGASDSSLLAPRPPGPPWSGPNDPVEIVVARLDPDPEAVDAAAALLSDEERQRAGRCVFDRHRRRFVVARATLRRLLWARLNVRPDVIEFVYGPHGKPALVRRVGDPDLRFNVSHTGEVAVYACALGREIGIDVEAVRAVHDADDIAARFFSRRENEAYLALERHHRPLGFFNCWTRKEAFIKAIGDGLSCPLGSFDVSLAPDEPARLLRVDDTPGDRCGWRMASFSPAPGFVGAVVIETEERRGGPADVTLLSALQARQS